MRHIHIYRCIHCRINFALEDPHLKKKMKKQQQSCSNESVGNFNCFLDPNYKDTNEVIKYYSAMATNYDTIIDNGYYRGPKIVASSVNDIIEDKNALLIDICGGTGSTALELRKYGFQNIDCIDACESMLEIAKQKSAYSNCICELLLPGKQSTLNAEKYDCVFCVGSFAPGHLQPEVVDEFIRILKNGEHQQGYCVIGMREEWLYAADDYRDKLEPYMFKLKKWRLIKREKFENWFENHSGILPRSVQQAPRKQKILFHLSALE
ncbi:Williams-Beuren syndrome chromosomal region 27 protein [Trichinella spiralis]|uniref:Williams-Beuren syndrome chromosomal region 27 protein n=2 Tax=Trichinella spiralis TaxID=6334 RepID=A0A0V1ARD5_TRISP|nr:Williams-Beuren syndrome chromosomal region 27 protein [Trichinella spiralis]